MYFAVEEMKRIFRMSINEHIIVQNNSEAIHVSEFFIVRANIGFLNTK